MAVSFGREALIQLYGASSPKAQHGKLCWAFLLSDSVEAVDFKIKDKNSEVDNPWAPNPLEERYSTGLASLHPVPT